MRNLPRTKRKGTAVGPDLTGIGRLGPAAIAMAARSTVTQYVEVLKVKDGGSFPAFTASKAGDKIIVFDLSRIPRRRRTGCRRRYQIGQR